MTTTATVRMTAGTLLGTVNSAATTVADTFGTATKAVGMLNSYVSTMTEKQAIRTKLEMLWRAGARAQYARRRTGRRRRGGT